MFDQTLAQTNYICVLTNGNLFSQLILAACKVAKSKTHPILECILIEVQPSKILIAADNLCENFVGEIDIDEYKGTPFKVVVKAENLKSVFTWLKMSDLTISFATHPANPDRTGIKLSCKSGDYTLWSMADTDPNGYPDSDFVVNVKTSLELKTHLLQNAIAHTIVAASNNANSLLDCIKISVAPDSLDFIATDRTSAAMCNFQVYRNGADMNALLQKSAARSVADTLATFVMHENTHIAFGSNQFSQEVATFTWTAKQMKAFITCKLSGAAPFPPVELLFKSTSKASCYADIEPKSLLNLLGRLEPLVKNFNQQINLLVKQESLLIWGTGNEENAFAEQIEISATGEVQACFNLLRLQSALTAISRYTNTKLLRVWLTDRLAVFQAENDLFYQAIACLEVSPPPTPPVLPSPGVEAPPQIAEESTSSNFELKAISLWQPWAFLIPLGLKQYETRSWKTNYRGKLLICSTATNSKQQAEYLKIKDELQLPPWEDFVHGCAIAICDLIDCIEMTSEFIEQQSATELLCGDWQVGRYALKLENVQPMLAPFPVKGKQGLFNVTVTSHEIFSPGFPPQEESLEAPDTEAPLAKREEPADPNPLSLLPPKLQKYVELKKQHPDKFLFFRMGDFYEVLFDDAEPCADILKLMRTSKAAGSYGRVPLTGVPCHSIEKYLNQIVQAGYSAVIADYLNEDTEISIVRTVTPVEDF